jgi:hypothetical protein
VPRCQGVVHSRRVSVWRVLATLAILALVAGWAAAQARADGDPASDVLVTQPLFLPQDAGLSFGRQTQLNDLLQEAARSGYPIRVALIASTADLGSVTELWRHPASYAQFLGEELSLSYHGALLVVMPNGYGLYRVVKVPSTTVPVPARSGLGAAAVAAVRDLAAVAGHPLALPPVSVRSAEATGGSDTPWIVAVTGAVIVLAAWGASLRARPPQLRHRTAD